MKDSELRRLMQNNKKFLSALYLQNGMVAKKTLLCATNIQIKLVLHVLYKIGSGQIPLQKEAVNELKKKKKLNVLTRNFTSFRKTNAILKRPKCDQLEMVMKFKDLYGLLFYFCFNIGPDSKESKSMVKDKDDSLEGVMSSPQI